MLTLCLAWRLIRLALRVHPIVVTWVNTCKFVAKSNHLLVLGCLACVSLACIRCILLKSFLIHLLLFSICEVIGQASLLLLPFNLVGCLWSLGIIWVLICISVLILRCILNILIKHLLHLILLVLSVLGLVGSHVLVGVDIVLVLLVNWLWADGVSTILSSIGTPRLVWWVHVGLVCLAIRSLVGVNHSILLCLVCSFTLVGGRNLTCTYSLGVSASLTGWYLLLWTASLPHWRVSITLHLLSLPRSKSHRIVTISSM